MIVLVFKGPDGRVGFTECADSRDAVETAYLYKHLGYHLMEHHLCDLGGEQKRSDKAWTD